ncbi:prepilin-type N-terminal cleavage/methylation domain-containing protein [Candidatus Uhrbacteria bacterium]|nr:prepilin-type N-terminal cleavage/methylation domain-containing protein [Candidatus Uhrbacteria bacterium]
MLPGFTFMELLVVIFVFTLLLAGAVDIFVRAQQAQRKVAATEKLHADARYLLQTITQALSGGGIDFGCYQDLRGNLGLCVTPIDLDVGNDQLALKRFDGSILRFGQGGTVELEPDICLDEKSKPCLIISDDNGQTWSVASSQGVKINKLRFYITPDQTPFVMNDKNEYANDKQPKVTVIFDATAQIKGFKETANLSVQTTISSREYRR